MHNLCITLSHRNKKSSLITDMDTKQKSLAIAGCKIICYNQTESGDKNEKTDT